MGIKTKIKKDKGLFVSEIECVKGWERDLGKKFLSYRKTWQKVCKNKLVTEFPMHLNVELNRTCNYSCIMCPRTVLKIRNSENKEALMDVGLYKKIIDEASKNNLHALEVSLFGEPCLRKDLPELLSYARRKGILDIRMHTNGALLSENISKKLLEAGLTFIQISLDANSKEVYEKIRVGGDFKTVKKNCLNFIKLKNSRRLSYPIVKVSFIRMEDNKKEIKEFIEFWKNKVNYISIQENIDFKNLLQENKRAINSNFVCPQLFQRLVVQWDGTVTPCCVDANNTLKLGNIKENSLKEIWNSKKLKAIRELHLSFNYHKIPVCSVCYASKNGSFQKAKDDRV